jgi:deoxyribodipyrimidine photo-lyase
LTPSIALKISFLNSNIQPLKMQKINPSALVWLRRDLRLYDHAALHHALKSASQVWCVFIFDSAILKTLPHQDRRVAFIHASVLALDRDLNILAQKYGKNNVRILVRHGLAEEEIARLAQALQVQAVYVNHDDDPYALARDAQVQKTLSAQGVTLHSFKDHVIFERSEVLTQAGKPYGVFTPYKNAWLKKLTAADVQPFEMNAYAAALAKPPPDLSTNIPSLESMGFEEADSNALSIQAGQGAARALLDDFKSRIHQYDAARNFPSIKGPSYLSMHLRFGAISIRELASLAWQNSLSAAGEGAQVWLSELIWRDFYHQILHHHPHVVTRSFKPEYDQIEWESGPEAETLFAAWCQGQTGYPLVDAAMNQLNQTGYMHNRLRMVVASFLVKDLGIDWRWGERYFAEKLGDFDLAANNGGWQWASSSGCDAQPYFRIFNPISQSEKFDAEGKFIRRYLPQLAKLPAAALHAPWLARPIECAEAGFSLGRSYPAPIVQHDEARQKTLKRYAVVKKPVSVPYQR